MKPKDLTPNESLEKAYRLQSGNREQIDRFKKNYTKLLNRINEQETEENAKGHLIDFLKEVYYKDEYLVATKGRTDFVIHTGKEATSTAGVLFEVKRSTNKSEMVTRENLNMKAMHELILYYFRERTKDKNSDLRYCIITNLYEWFIFDAVLFERLFYKNSDLVKEYKAWDLGQKVSLKNELFYNEIAKPFLERLNEEITFTYFDIRNFKKIVSSDNTANDKALLPLYKILSPTHLLKLPITTDSNRLNPKFYSELLHIIGLEEVNDGSKKVIRRKDSGKQDEGSLIENTIIQLDTGGKLNHLPDLKQYGITTDEQLFNVALELCITWINRILFLKLLESQLVNYHNQDKTYSFLNHETIADFAELFKLFFEVLAKRPASRRTIIQTKFGRIPYLNSSLFEISDLEDATINVNSLDNSQTLPLFRNSVLKDNSYYKNTKQLPTLPYLFAFLDAYDFASESRETIQDKSRSLINASVLGLIFEKINGYKDGSFYTPGFITEYMCRETVRKAVVQKFNTAKGWDCADFAALQDKDLDRGEANTLINELTICDPAVGSGHFLVSALNELIAIKSDLCILQDETGKRIKGYTVNILNDELIIQDDDEIPFQYFLQATGKPTPERQRIQKTLFQEKQTLIENCLFGVDINPNSVKICRLRLWIELLKNAYYTDESNFTELETLPNIDINIKHGNSLLSKFSLKEDLTEVFKKQRFSLQTYKESVKAYKEVKTREAKVELQRFITEIKSQFRETVFLKDPLRKNLLKLRTQRAELDIDTDMFGNKIKKGKAVSNPKLIESEKLKYDKKIAKAEAEIASIENNAIYRGSFEWRFEFPEVLNEKGDFLGFDVVIGNPPYGVNLNSNFGPTFSKVYQTFTSRGESYVLFMEKAVSIMKQNGAFGFIIPDTLLNLGFTQAARSFVLKYTQLTELILLPTSVFNDAKVDTILLFFQKIQPAEELVETDVSVKVFGKKAQLTSLVSPERSFIISSKAWFKSQSFNVQGNDAELQIIGNIDNNFPALESFADIFYGIKAYQVGKGKPAQTRKIVDDKPFTCSTKPNEAWLPFFDGKHIGRYSLLWENNNWLNYGLWLAEPRIPIKFEDEKILIRKITGKTLIATYIPYTSYCNTLLFVLKLIPDKAIIPYKSLLGILNSTFIGWYFKKKFQISDEDTFPQIMIRDILQFAVPNLSNSIILKIETFVDQILDAKATDSNANTTALEAEIDLLVYTLYGLSDKEINIIEG